MNGVVMLEELDSRKNTEIILCQSKLILSQYSVFRVWLATNQGCLSLALCKHFVGMR